LVQQEGKDEREKGETAGDRPDVSFISRRGKKGKRRKEKGGKTFSSFGPPWPERGWPLWDRASGGRGKKNRPPFYSIGVRRSNCNQTGRERREKAFSVLSFCVSFMLPPLKVALRSEGFGKERGGGRERGKAASFCIFHHRRVCVVAPTKDKREKKKERRRHPRRIPRRGTKRIGKEKRKRKEEKKKKKRRSAVPLGECLASLLRIEQPRKKKKGEKRKNDVYRTGLAAVGRRDSRGGGKEGGKKEKQAALKTETGGRRGEKRKISYSLSIRPTRKSLV